MSENQKKETEPVCDAQIVPKNPAGGLPGEFVPDFLVSDGMVVATGSGPYSEADRARAIEEQRKSRASLARYYMAGGDKYPFGKFKGEIGKMENGWVLLMRLYFSLSWLTPRA